MTETKKKTGKKIKFGRIKIFILFGVLVYAGITLAGLQTKIAAQSEKQVALNSEKEAAALDLEYYENELNYVGSDEYVEKQARERLGWLHPDEEKYVEAQAAEST